MSDMKLTNAKMKTFDGDEKISTFQAGARLADFGEKQNNANVMLAGNVNDLIKRVCFLEDQNLQLTETLRHLADKQLESINKINTEHANAMKALTSEMKSLKAELDRVRLASKLNTSAIDRLNTAVSTAENSTADKNSG
ncbi:MAG: hypothetical protein NC177_10030 [Ruminococcus flavefaciens]|nr:hypothetical protein [Ruminococcus flavefaciens]